MSHKPEPNVSVSPNVMTIPKTPHDEIRFLPGDLAFLIYRKWWTSPSSLQTAMTDKQRIEYEQHLVCHLCERPCAGTCTRQMATS